MPADFILLISIFLLFSFLSSGFETAFVSLDIDKIFLASSKFTRKVFLKKPREILNTILLLNNLFNAAIAIFITGYFTVKDGFLRAIVTGTIISFILIILMGEILPKILASKYPFVFMRLGHIFIYFFYRISYPLIYLITRIYDKIFKSEYSSKRDELLWLIFMKERRGIINPEIGRTLKSSLYFSEKEVVEVLKPRTELFAINLNSGINEIKQRVKDKEFNKIPVYKDDLDNIKGYVYKKDIMESQNLDELKNRIKKILFFPENSKLEHALKRMIEEKIYISIVVDEYGGTQGFFTLEDVANEIIGELPERAEAVIVDGVTRIDDLKEIYGISFPPGPYETIAGFLIELKGDFPYEGEVIEYGGYKFQVISRDRKRIKRVKIFR